MRAKRDYAMLAMLFGCGFRRSELVGLELDDIQMRQGHWAVVDLIGKGGHIRTVPIPNWVKVALDQWIRAANIREGKIFRASRQTLGKVWGGGFPQANRFMVHLLAAVGEYEAKLILDSTKAALQSAKRRGVRLGGDRGNILDIHSKGSRVGNSVRTAKAQQRAGDLKPVIADIQAKGAGSLRGIAAQLNARGIQTARGYDWTPSAVMRVLKTRRSGSRNAIDTGSLS